MYKNEEEARFDFDYCVKAHMAMAEPRLRDFGLLGWSGSEPEVQVSEIVCRG